MRAPHAGDDRYDASGAVGKPMILWKHGTQRQNYDGVGDDDPFAADHCFIFELRRKPLPWEGVARGNVAVIGSRDLSQPSPCTG